MKRGESSDRTHIIEPYSDTRAGEPREDQNTQDKMQGINQETKSTAGTLLEQKPERKIRYQSRKKKEGNLCFEARLPTLRGYYLRTPIRIRQGENHGEDSSGHCQGE